MEEIDSWTVDAYGVTWHVALYPDTESSPSDWTDSSSEPDLFSTFQNGDWSFIRVAVAPSVTTYGRLDAFETSLSAVQYGQGPGRVSDRESLSKDYVPDLIAASLEQVDASDLQSLVDAAAALAVEQKAIPR